MIPEFVIVHHSATRDSGTVSWNAIRRWHVDHNRWSAIGYHAGVELITDPGTGALVPEVLIGRDWFTAGAHCRHDSMNQRSLGLCVVGDFDAGPPPEQLVERAAQFVAMWCRLFMLSVDRVHGHRDHHPSKTCPGDRFDMAHFRDCVEALQ